jgi:hypothetical protein
MQRGKKASPTKNVADIYQNIQRARCLLTNLLFIDSVLRLSADEAVIAVAILLNLNVFKLVEWTGREE